MRYKEFISLFLFIFFAFSHCSSHPEPEEKEVQEKKEKIKVIFETDMCLDVDDVGALAILHVLADKEEAEILAVCFNEVHPNGAAAIDAINTWYGRGDIPIGIYKGVLEAPDESRYLPAVASYPQDIPTDNSQIPDALEVYRSVLAQQPDQSVVIISVGFLNNLEDLLKADPELVSRKVTKVVMMGGIQEDEFNFVRHNLVSVTENILRNWPTPIVLTQLGGDVYTGACLADAPDSPIRMAWYKWFDNKFEGRSSWDAYAVLYAIGGTTWFNESWEGYGSLPNGYTYPMEKGFRGYITPKLSNRDYQHMIDEMLLNKPA